MDPIKEYNKTLKAKVLNIIKDGAIALGLLFIAYLGLCGLAWLNTWQISNVAYNAMQDYPAVNNDLTIDAWKLDNVGEVWDSSMPYYVAYQYHNATGWNNIYAWVHQDKTCEHVWM
jgi:hypothetical protein